MNEFEYVESYFLITQTMNNNFVAITTVVFAYILVAHFAGNKLSSSVVSGLNVIYSLFLFGPVSARFYSISKRNEIAIEYAERFPDGIVLNEAANLAALYIVGQGPLLLAWILSIIYMHNYIRRSDFGKGHTT